MDDESCTRENRRNAADRKLDFVDEVRIPMQNVNALVEHVLHEEPGDEPGAEPEDIGSIASQIASGAKAHFKRKPEAEDVHRRLDEEPCPGKHRTTALLLKFEQGQFGDAMAPLPIVLEDRS